MKKYILAALLAAFVMIGPSVGSANAQGYFYRGGPTFVDRLFGNGGGYGNYGGYGMGYGGYNPYAYNTSFYRGGYVNPFAGYGGYNRFNNCGWHHHHWHHHW